MTVRSADGVVRVTRRAGGGPLSGRDPQLLDIVSPHDRSVIARAAQAQPHDIDRAVAAARESFDEGVWRLTPPAERIAALRRFNALREENAERIAELTPWRTARRAGSRVPGSPA